jgi:acetyl esterase
MGKLDIRSRLDPEMAAAVDTEARLAAEAAERHGLADAAPDDLAAIRTLYNANRAYWNRNPPEMADSADFTIPGPDGAVPVRLHRPKNAGGGPAPVLIYLHGGGWIVGTLDTHDRIMKMLADLSGWAVLGVDYRLAPEAKFPGPQRDCAAAADWVLAEGAARGLDPTRIALAGDSAGANMSMAVLLHMRRAGSLDSAKAALLYYGSYGLRDSASRRLWGGPEDGLSASDLAFFRQCLMSDPAELEDPEFDILANDLTGLPPLFVLEVAMDPLADDSAALTAAVRAAGGRVRHRRVEGVLHGYLHMSAAVEKARLALEDGTSFLKDLT